MKKEEHIISAIPIDTSTLMPKDCIGYVFKNADGIYSILTELEYILKAFEYFDAKPQQVVLVDFTRQPKPNEYYTNGFRIWHNKFQLDAYIGLYPIVASFPKLAELPLINKQFLGEWIHKPINKILMDTYTMADYKEMGFNKSGTCMEEGNWMLEYLNQPIVTKGEVTCSFPEIKFSDTSETIQPLKDLRQELEGKSKIHKCPKCGSGDVCFEWEENEYICPNCGMVDIDEKATNEKKSIQVLICQNCKAFHFAPKDKCQYCGSTTLIKTHPYNAKFVERGEDGGGDCVTCRFGQTKNNHCTNPKTKDISCNYIAAEHMNSLWEPISSIEANILTFSEKGKSVEQILYMALNNLVKHSTPLIKDQVKMDEYLKAKEIAVKVLRMVDDIVSPKNIAADSHNDEQALNFFLQTPYTPKTK
jgi:hypothetical protein